MILRGVEGSIQLPLDRRAPCIVDGVDDFVRSGEFGLVDVRVMPDLGLSVSDSLEAGVAVLRGEDRGVNRETILYLAHVILHRFGLSGSNLLEMCLDEGRALRCWEMV